MTHLVFKSVFTYGVTPAKLTYITTALIFLHWDSLAYTFIRLLSSMKMVVAATSHSPATARARCLRLKQSTEASNCLQNFYMEPAMIGTAVGEARSLTFRPDKPHEMINNKNNKPKYSASKHQTRFVKLKHL